MNLNEMDFGEYDDEFICPICCEDLEEDDLATRYCECKFMLCGFCYSRINEDDLPRCPGCREPYDPSKRVYDQEGAKDLILRFQYKKALEKQRTSASIIPHRMNLANKRVIQKNLIYLTNLPLKYSSEEALRKCGVLTRFGKVIKCVVNKRPSTTTTNATCCAHITYETIDEAYDALQGLNDTVLEGKHLKAQYGTTKYCTMYLKNEKCPNPNCMYLHELGGDDAQEESLERDYHMYYNNNQNKLPNAGSFSPTNRNSTTPEYKLKTSKMDSSKGLGSALPATAAWGRGVTPTSTPPSNSPSNFPSLSMHSPQDTPRLPTKTLRIVSSKPTAPAIPSEKSPDLNADKLKPENPQPPQKTQSPELSEKETLSTTVSSPDLSQSQASIDDSASSVNDEPNDNIEPVAIEKSEKIELPAESLENTVEKLQPTIPTTVSVENISEKSSPLPTKPPGLKSGTPSLLDLFLNNSDRPAQQTSELPKGTNDPVSLHPMFKNIPDLCFDRRSTSIPPSSQPNMFNPFETKVSTALHSRQSSISKLSLRDSNIVQPPQGQFTFPQFKSASNLPPNVDLSHYRQNIPHPTHLAQEPGHSQLFANPKLLDDPISRGRRMQSPQSNDPSQFPNMFQPEFASNPSFPNRPNQPRSNFAPFSPQLGNPNTRPYGLNTPGASLYSNPNMQPQEGLGSASQFGQFPPSSSGFARQGLDNRSQLLLNSFNGSNVAPHGHPRAQMQGAHAPNPSNRLNFEALSNRTAFDSSLQMSGFRNEASTPPSGLPHNILHNSGSAPNLPPGLLRKPAPFAQMNQASKQPGFDPKLRQLSSNSQTQLDVLANVCQDMSQTSSPTKTPPFNHNLEPSPKSRSSTPRILPPGLHPPNLASFSNEGKPSISKPNAPPGLGSNIPNTDLKSSTQGIPINLEQFFSGSLPPGLIPPKKNMSEFPSHQPPPGMNLPAYSSTSINASSTYFESPSVPIQTTTPSISNIPSNSSFLPNSNSDNFLDIRHEPEVSSDSLSSVKSKKAQSSIDQSIPSPSEPLKVQPNLPHVRKVLVLKDNHNDQTQQNAQMQIKSPPALDHDLSKVKPTASNAKPLTKAEKLKEKEKERKLKQKEKDLEKEKINEKKMQRIREIEVEKEQRIRELDIEREQLLEKKRELEKQKQMLIEAELEKEKKYKEKLKSAHQKNENELATPEKSGKKNKSKSTPEISKESLIASTDQSKEKSEELKVIIPIGFGEEANSETNTFNQMSKKQRKKWKAQEKARLEAEAKSDSSLLVNFSNEDPIYSELPYFKNNQQDSLPSIKIPKLDDQPIDSFETSLGIQLNNVMDEILYHQYNTDDKSFSDAHRDIIANVQKDKCKWDSLDKYLGIEAPNQKNLKNPSKQVKFGDNDSVHTIFNTLYGQNPFESKVKSDATHHVSFDFSLFTSTRDQPVNLKRFLDIRQPQDPAKFITNDARAISTTGLDLDEGLELLYKKAEQSRYQQQMEEMLCFKAIEENAKLFCPNI